MQIPNLREAQALLQEAESLNPGPWADHSRHVAEAARLIALHDARLDPQAAYILGLLHDIGRREGPSHIKHVWDGYHHLLNFGYPDAAAIALSHSFPVQHLGAYSGEQDLPNEQLALLEQALAGLNYTPYDRLIQLCDSLCLPSGWVLMEKRLVDVVRRYGFNDFTLRKWQAFFDIKSEFEAATGCSIYQLLPGLMEHTFASSA